MPFLPPGFLAQPDRGINHVIAYGQSLSSGWEGWPALSTQPRLDSLMLGGSVRPAQEAAPSWVPVGAASFQPLRSTVQSGGDGHLLSPQEVAALPADSVALGETVLEAALAEWRGRLRTAHPPRRLLASSAGVGGRTLEALSKGTNPELFHRLRSCASLARAVAGGDYAITALLMLQGESNAWALDGGTADRAAYKALLARFLADFDADVVRGIAGQTALPAMFIHQAGGAYADDGMGVAMAQLDIAVEHPRVFMAGPVYPVTDKGGHLDANGYRWLGAQFGRVMHRVITLGEDWRPLHPLAATSSGAEIRVDFHVPAPPLAWGRPYAGHHAMEWADRGFTVIENGAAVPVTGVVLGPTHVTLRLGHAPGPGAELLYADRSGHGGGGNLRDSEPAVAMDRYEYDRTTGHRPTADIAELIGKPYKLHNWCVAFRIPVARLA